MHEPGEQAVDHFRGDPGAVIDHTNGCLAGEHRDVDFDRVAPVALGVGDEVAQDLAQPGTVGDPHGSGADHLDFGATAAQLVDEMPHDPATAPSLEALAEAIGCDAAGLVGAVREWNETVTSGTDRDPVFGRVIFPDPRLGIVESPFHASQMVVGINFPAGGFRVTTDTQVINVFGEPIEGLFAVGDCVGGISPTIGLGGMKISAALTLGRIAGRVIATDAVQNRPRVGLIGSPALPANTMRIAVVDE
mgnify:CR=1 FL=1